MAERWTFDTRVDGAAFKALGYAETSAGIAERQREHRDGWWAHAKRSKSFILDAALRLSAPRLAVVLGAGKAYDLPLAELAQRFERVILVDIDAEALAQTAQAAVREPALQRRLELRALDLSGVGARFARAIEESSGSDAATTEAALTALCASYRLANGARLLDERADLIVSALVLTQLALPLKLYARRVLKERFGAALQPEPWDELDLRMQQDHIDALPRAASLAVLISETTHRVTALEGGKERATGESWSLIGDKSLGQRVPGGVEIVTRAAWQWPRIRASRENPGALMDVEGLVLSSTA